MANFNEHALEMSIMELFKDEGYIHLNGSQIHRERTEVLLQEDLKQYLYNRYAKDGITPGEVEGILLMLRNISGTLYEANKAFYKLLCDGFILNREDRTQKDIYIELIDFDTPENNIFKGLISLRSRVSTISCVSPTALCSLMVSLSLSLSSRVQSKRIPQSWMRTSS